MGGYFSPPPYRGDRIGDLLLQGGQIAAERAQRSGDIWSNALRGVGQVVEQYGAQAEEKRRIDAMAKRDAAIAKTMESWDGQDPRALYQGLLRIGGPEIAMKYVQGAVALQGLTDKADKENEARFNTTLQTAATIPPQMTARFWPHMRPRIAPAAEQFLGIPADQIPEEFTPELHQTIQQLWRARSGEKVGTREIKVRNADGSETVKIVEDRPGFEATSAPEPQKPRVVGRTLLGPNNEVLYRDPTEPKEPKEQKLEKIETVDPVTGKAVTQFVEPKAGASYAKPTGQGKPATGQQKRALNFFNRGKEAGEIAASLEDNIAKYSLAQQGRLAYEGLGSNFLKSDEMQSYRQAQRAFTEARLRKDSGAAVPEKEYENDAKTYFAQPGDSAATIAQKRAQRNAILASIAFESGDALREFYGDEAEGMIEGYRAQSKVGGAGLPKVGQTVNGYVYKGGDPNSPSSWAQK